MRSLLLLLLLIPLVCYGTALSVGEREGIQAFLQNFPALAHASPPWTNDSNPCADPPFYGLTCSNETDPHVLKLFFNASLLEGVVPPEIGKLLWLQEFLIHNACVSGVLPLSIGALKNLTRLEVSDSVVETDTVPYNCYVGSPTTIPKAIVRLKSLETLILKLSSFAGSIPSELGMIASLKHLHLRGSFLTNETNLKFSVPASIMKHQGLKTLRLEELSLGLLELTPTSHMPELELLSFAGSLDLFANIAYYSRSTKLHTIDFSRTSINLEFETLEDLHELRYFKADRLKLALSWMKIGFWRNFPSLRYFSTTHNPQLFGILDESFGTLTNLTYFNASESRFMGTIPASIEHCPLEAFSIINTQMLGPIPSEIGNISTLQHLEIVNLRGAVGPGAPGSTIPASIGKLTNLITLSLSLNRHFGTIPPMIALSKLQVVRLDGNVLTGSIPPIVGLSKQIFFDAHNNRLNGSIPRSIAARASHLILNDNELGPEIFSDLFQDNKGLREISLAHNRFSGPLPRLRFLEYGGFVDMSHNSFEGEVPSGYCTATDLQLNHNSISGSLDPLLLQFCPNIQTISLAYNSLQGTFPDVDHFTALTKLTIRNNGFIGALPNIPIGMSLFDASYNTFTGFNMPEWSITEAIHTLNYLDLSHNKITVPRGYNILPLFTDNMGFLSLAHNDLQFAKPLFPSIEVPALVALDLSYTNLYDAPFPTHIFPNLAVLKLRYNNFIGTPDWKHIRSLTELDIAHNSFDFDVARFSALPLLAILSAEFNYIHGALALEDMSNLQTANLAENRLNHEPDFGLIGSLFSSRLRFLNISANPDLLPMDSFNTAKTGMAKSSVSAPSLSYPDTVTCYELSFNHLMGRSLLFDESLFMYRQCDCNQEHFGAPPLKCLKCPPTGQGVTSCGGTDLKISKHSFVFSIPTSNQSPAPATSPEYDYSVGTLFSEASNFARSVWSYSLGDYPGSLANANKPTPSDSISNETRLETESCLVTTLQVLSGKSNCRGLNISSSDLAGTNVSVSKLLESQCKRGSEGRLCSKCTCNVQRGESCWFPSGPVCLQCRRVYRLSVTLPITALILTVVIIVLSPIMAVCLRRKRLQGKESYDKLPLFRRIFHRLVFLTTLGNVSILVTFLQMLVVFTDWDQYIRFGFLGIVNGRIDSFGLRCLFPFLANPLWVLLLQLSMPFVFSGIISASIGLGSLIANRWERQEEEERAQVLTSGSIINYESPLLQTSKEIAVSYPTSALVTSLLASTIKFFYFGTALAAHQYLFSMRHANGTKYVQSTPWMKSSEAANLIMASVPAILIFDFAIPIAFIVLCWKVRHSFNLPSVQNYYGSLFASYDSKCFWWEAVSTLKKLSIALILQASPSSNAAQSAIVVTILSGTLLIQLILNPWGRKIENYADAASSLLLTGALISTRPSHLSNAPEVVWYVFALSVIFVVVSVGVIIWQTWTGTTDYERRVAELEHGQPLLSSLLSPYQTEDDWSMRSETTLY